MKLQIQPGHENFDKMHGKRNDTILLSGCFYQYFSASGAGQGSIDNRIEQAMDLVKSHLMSAVRSEVEELREKIAKLEDTVQVLSRENDTLRNHVAPEVLNQLPNPAQRGLLGPQHLNSLPPPEPAHPALQPPQH
jgi:FtsZ-binding cell division protein ZapB